MVVRRNSDPAVISTEDGAFGRRRSPLSGWMRLQSRGLLASMVRRSPRVYVTLDFESQILCVDRWTPVRFQDLKQVEPLTKSSESIGDFSSMGESSTTSLRSSTSGLATYSSPSTRPNSLGASSRVSRLLLGGGCGVAEKYGFVLQTVDRKMTCFCSSELEADEWVVRLREAMSSKQDHRSRSIDCERWASPSSSCESSPTLLGTPPRRSVSCQRHKGRVGSATLSKDEATVHDIKSDHPRKHKQYHNDEGFVSL
mmetsp:Transcript_109334/g.193640  ORF Transcript_109334/g.193640 Transcript_109334/m.193640 type:complete len:255 (+) Transcript_109334:55-819(+)